MADPPEALGFSPEIRRRTRDLRLYPHVFVFMCIFDRNIPGERVAPAVLELWRRLGDFSFHAIERLPLEAIQKAMTRPTKLHRFHGQMARNVFAAIRLIRDEYAGDASRIWSDGPAAATLIQRFRRFRGIGEKIAPMAALILYRDFRVAIRDASGFDVAPDVHLRRVLSRLGMVSRKATDRAVIVRCRKLHPGFPGLLDLPLWEVGRDWCHARRPDCAACSLRGACPTAPGAGGRVKARPT